MHSWKVTEFLATIDMFWVEAKDFLEKSGYSIPPKFDLAYAPSSYLEKSAALARMPRPTLVNATRLKDQVPVIIKKVSPSEAKVAIYLSNLPYNERNHCVPIYEVLKFDSWDLLVMPQLRPCHDPAFDTVGEVLECFRQLFEGIQFMHKHKISHGDPILANLMMSADEMYPESFDAAQIWKRRDGKGRVKAVCTRAQCWPRYYIIDFEHSKRFSSNYQGIAFNDMTDASRTPGQNPFPNDIHYLGQFLKHHFLDNRVFKRRHLEFLRPLVNDMLHETPSLRPTIDDVVLRFSHILKATKKSHMRHMVQPKGDHWQEDLFFPIHHVYLRAKHTLLFNPPIPKGVKRPTAVIPKALRHFYTQPRHGDEEGADTLQARISIRFSHYKDVPTQDEIREGALDKRALLSYSFT